MAEAMHPNLSLMAKLNLQDLDACKHIISEDFVWRYFNRELPELEGDYRGIDGLKGFFTKLGERTGGSFQARVVDAHAVGEELVVVQVCNRMVLDGREVEVDAVAVWRIVSGKIAEAWDIPAVNTLRTAQKG